MKLLFLALLLVSCAHTPNPQLEEKVKGEANVTTPGDLSAEITSEIDADPSLTNEQKEQLKALHLSHSERMQALSKEMLQLRAVLVKDLLADNYDEEEVSSIKRRIRRNADNRVTAMFEAVDKANKIIGRGSEAARKRAVRKFVEPEAHGIDRE